MEPNHYSQAEKVMYRTAFDSFLIIPNSKKQKKIYGLYNKYEYKRKTEQHRKNCIDLNILEVQALEQQKGLFFVYLLHVIVSAVFSFSFFSDITLFFHSVSSKCALTHFDC